MDPGKRGSREWGPGKSGRQKDKRVRDSGASALVEVKYVVTGFGLSEAREESGKVGKNK